ncbi:MAG: hypothetical protein ACFFDN_46120, partial [Candidatus Hodarchaeota archaeon]
VTCKKRLTTLWFVGASFLLLLFFFQTLFGKYKGIAMEAWGWLMPTIMPSLSLVLGVWGMYVLDMGVKTKKVDRFVFRLSFALSALYLSLVTLTILFQPFTLLSPLDWMKQSNLWLGPLQGLVSASLGVFFVKRE